MNLAFLIFHFFSTKRRRNVKINNKKGIGGILMSGRWWNINIFGMDPIWFNVWLKNALCENFAILQLFKVAKREWTCKYILRTAYLVNSYEVMIYDSVCCWSNRNVHVSRCTFNYVIKSLSHRSGKKPLKGWKFSSVITCINHFKTPSKPFKSHLNTNRL